VGGSSHTIATSSPQSGGTGVRFNWANWSGGGAISHNVAPTANKTYTATFNKQYYLVATDLEMAAEGWHARPSKQSKCSDRRGPADSSDARTQAFHKCNVGILLWCIERTTQLEKTDSRNDPPKFWVVEYRRKNAFKLAPKKKQP
jgi:hypothetical protein